MAVVYLWLLFLSSVLLVAHSLNPYNFNFMDIGGNNVEMKKFSGKVMLIVNVASECGYTDKHYKELVELQNRFSNNIFTVLAFPCNQFGKQEPGNNNEIYNFARNYYNVNFHVFGKIDVAGDNAHPLYKWLKESTGGYEPNWNFSKYLIDKHGKVVRAASARINPLEMSEDIQKLVNGKPLQRSMFAYEDGTYPHDEF